MKTFDELWRFIDKRCACTVQNREELEYVFNLMNGCTSYLEVGTAEGNSLYVLAHALNPGSEITYIDFGEKHTEENRNVVLDRLHDYDITAIHGDSNAQATRRHVEHKRYDVVLIDAGHDDFNVAIDALFYGDLATKYLIFHDVQLKDVSRVFDWYCRQYPDRKAYRVVNSENFGFGIMEIS